jgi:dTDP-4-dehydrorhamnose reductase
MRILITGASGLLGLNLALELSKAHTVFGTVNRHILRTSLFHVQQADLDAPEALEHLLDETQPDWVIHCAALADLDRCEAVPDLAYRLNAELPGRLATLVARGGARLIHISTDAVFDGVRGNYTEDDVPNPLSIYARTKLAGERAVLAADPAAIVARVNLFGWSLSGKRSLGEFFVYNLQAGQGVKGFTDVCFCPLLSNDMAPILEKILEKGLSGLYHLVSCDCVSKYDFGVAIARQFDLDEKLITPTSMANTNLKAARSPNLSLRSDKLAAALGEPLPRLSPAIHRFYTLYQQGYPQALKRLGSTDS